MPADRQSKEKLTGFVNQQVEAFERVIADAPEQWWTLFFQIWDDIPARRHRRGQELMGRADLHIHILASDGVSSVAEILDHAQNRAKLDVIAITDHERIDAAHAARAMAEARGMSLQVDRR